MTIQGSLKPVQTDSLSGYCQSAYSGHVSIRNVEDHGTGVAKQLTAGHQEARHVMRWNQAAGCPTKQGHKAGYSARWNQEAGMLSLR